MCASSWGIETGSIVAAMASESAAVLYAEEESELLVRADARAVEHRAGAAQAAGVYHTKLNVWRAALDRGW